MIYDAIVLGAGVSGITSTKLILNAENVHTVSVMDTYEKLGGNHIDININGYTFDVGSFLFHNQSPFLETFPELSEYYIPVKARLARITPSAGIQPYPFSVEAEILAKSMWEKTRIFSSLLYNKLRHGHPHNASDFARYYIGSYLFHSSGLANYMLRFYNMSPDQIDIRFAEERMGWIRNTASLRKILKRRITPSPSGGPAQQAFVRSREGFHFLYSKAAAILQQAGATFFLGAKLEKITREDGVFCVASSDRTVRARRLISTIPVREALALCGLADEPELQTVPLVSLFFSFRGQRNFSQPILYNFAHSGKWKRLTMHSDFYGPSEGREYFSVEVNNLTDEPVEALEADFRRHATECGLFAGDLEWEGSHTLEHAYPIIRHGSLARVEAAIDRLKAFGVESLGRQGGFSYLPTANVAVTHVRKQLNL